ncbi:helix-turn-helix transcriptional regulator [Pedobacter aquatilis]|uniref:helix-turn-helix transcriptional regulator n=1 Tax=Pedobacter aquatilis TaxID=351343 RepID=UPI00292DD385|nr:LuxR C-terminal-related transcriptional regulator [Pedobacter aquatilis]
MAVIPWGVMDLFIYFNVSKWIEILFINLEFAVITPVFISYSVRRWHKNSTVVENFHFPTEEVFEENLLNYGFSLREKQVIRLLKLGYTKKQVSDKLFIAISTVSRHVQNIYDKAQVNNRLSLMNKLEKVSDFDCHLKDSKRSQNS